MGKFVKDSTMDLALADIATCTLLSVCSGAGTTTDGTLAAATLASVVLTAGDGNGDYVIADGTSGRKVTVAQQADISITGATADATHVVLSLGGVVKLVTTCTTQTLTNGGTVTVPTFSNTIADPT